MPQRGTCSPGRMDRDASRPRRDGALRAHSRRGAEPRRSRRPSRAASAPARPRSRARSFAPWPATPSWRCPSPTFTLMQVLRRTARRRSSMRISTASSGARAGRARLGRDDRQRHRPRRMARARREARSSPSGSTSVSIFAPGRQGTDGRAGDAHRHRRRSRRALQRLQGLPDLVERAAGPRPRARPMQGDASTRAYERLVKPDGETAILMISPAAPGRAAGAARQALQRHRQARRDPCMPSWPSIGACARSGFSAPRIYGEDLEAGLLLIEDLGAEPVVDGDGPIPERYARGDPPPRQAPRHGRCRRCCRSPRGSSIAIPPYDLEALLIEVELLVDWYVPHIVGTQLSGSARAEFVNLWSEAPRARFWPRPPPGPCATTIRPT